eukprot:m51a1_g6147 putative gata-binding transcription factor (181) ;mRNA; r:292032-292911
MECSQAMLLLEAAADRDPASPWNSAGRVLPSLSTFLGVFSEASPQGCSNAQTTLRRPVDFSPVSPPLPSTTSPVSPGACSPGPQSPASPTDGNDSGDETTAVMLNAMKSAACHVIKLRHRRRSPKVDKAQLYCHKCGTRTTPQWRQGPAGPATLCNACGLKLTKESTKSRHGKVKGIILL